MEQLFNVTIFLVFLALWAAFAYGLLADQAALHGIWQRLGDQHILVQGVVWLLFLPLTIGLWIWETSWPLIVRLVLVLSVGGWNLWMFFPRTVVGR